MLRRLIILLFLAPFAARAAPVALSVEQQQQVHCVAVLAIVANEQARGIGGWDDVPPLVVRGAQYSDRVGGMLVRDAGRSREEARADVVAELAAIQAAAPGGDASAMLRDALGPCLVRLDAEVPLPKPPALPECAAALSLAYDDEVAQHGMSDAARVYAYFAGVLDGKARDELKAAGKTEAESDIVIGLERERLRALIKPKKRKVAPAQLDYRACLELGREQ